MVRQAVDHIRDSVGQGAERLRHATYNIVDHVADVGVIHDSADNVADETSQIGHHVRNLRDVEDIAEAVDYRVGYVGDLRSEPAEVVQNRSEGSYQITNG